VAQTTLHRAVSAAATSTGVYIGEADSVTIQCSPDPNQGFDGTIGIDGAFVPHPATDICFPIATFGIPPWFRVATLGFSAHLGVLTFTIKLSKEWTWIRASVVTANIGAISIHMAY
jgi:hypothetical protein